MRRERASERAREQQSVRAARGYCKLILSCHWGLPRTFRFARERLWCHRMSEMPRAQQANRVRLEYVGLLAGHKFTYLLQSVSESQSFHISHNPACTAECFRLRSRPPTSKRPPYSRLTAPLLHPSSCALEFVLSQSPEDIVGAKDGCQREPHVLKL